MRLMPCISSAEASMVTLAPAIMALSTSCAVWTPLVRARSAWMRPYRMAIQRSGRRSSFEVLSTRLGATSRVSMSRSGWIEAVEQHQAVRAGLHQPVGQVGQRGEERAELDRQRDIDLAADILDQVDVGLFQLLAGQVEVGGEVVHVQLQGIGAGLFDLLA